MWWPFLPIERWQRLSGASPDTTVALVEEAQHGQRIVAVTTAAAAGGAHPGMRLTDARTLFPALAAVPADTAGDAALVERLARWAGRWSPLVEVDGGDGLRLDVTGTAHLFGGEEALRQEVEARFAAQGLTTRVAIAATAGAAWALARYSRSPRGRSEDDLAPLPVAALRLSPQANHTLHRLGLKTIGALAGVPRRSLARRFREADNPLDALDRALGRTPEPLTALAVEPPPRATLRLAEPVADPAVLGQALAKLADPLARMLAARRLGARRILLTAWRIDGEVGEAGAETSLPTREAAHLVRLLAEKVGSIDPGFGIDAFALTATWCEPLDAAQDALIGEAPRERELARLVDRLTVRLGPGRVQRPEARASHLPERASRWVSGIFSPSRKQEGDERARPARLLDHPEAIGVIYATPEGMPRRFVWRHVVHDIARVEGPERIAPEWWRQPGGTRLRDYYRVEDSKGCRYWIYRDGIAGDGRGGAPDWYVHGLFG